MSELTETNQFFDAIYPNSKQSYEGSHIYMAKKDGQDYVVVKGQSDFYDELEGDILDNGEKVALANHATRLVLNKYFDYTVPQAFGTEIATIGLGDRLGLAGRGQLLAVKGHAVRPVLAQQSIRELNLTNRSLTDVLDAAAFAVFKENYHLGFGADGDHLKLEEDIEYALNTGVSMLTLDCSDYIDNQVTEYSAQELEEKYLEIDADSRKEWEATYLEKEFDFEDFSIHFDKATLMYNAVQYHAGIEYMIKIFNKYVRPLDKGIDFEVSIDETMTVTSPASHFFVANELYKHDIKVNSLAPRFIGQFQKGIDYMGDIEAFELDFSQHCQIADHFGYKISVHSGSDKFSVFPIVAKYTKGRFHVKTAGTNWLEALKVIASHDYDLFRQLYKFAMDNFAEAQKYYYITPDLSNLPNIDDLKDEELVNYLADDNARQLLHVTYGLILTNKDENDEHYLFRDQIYASLDKYDNEYADTLHQHIKKHIDLLNVAKENV
ncbi:tagaturonate epimerase family protein [Fundicoccus sp. Sow4_H7]|uniref:tagaturonate epimerase family protein n=1 Tax=Fundicoccus sp. Sow4_H7 TaxID=3438784 RepID=UPI003F9380CA